MLSDEEHEIALASGWRAEGVIYRAQSTEVDIETVQSRAGPVPVITAR